MSTHLSPFATLKGAVLAFFKHDLVLERRQTGMRVILEDRAQATLPRPPSREERAAQKDRRDLEQTRHDLAHLLDDDAALRSTMRHLAFVEHALGKKGWRALHKVPLDVLQKALQQLEGLVTNWSSAGLACLRSKMAVAVIDREHQDEGETDVYKTSALLENPPVLAAQAIENARASSSAEEEDAALMAAYAALGVAGTPAAGVELQAELGSPSAKALARSASRAPGLAVDAARPRQPNG